MGNRLSKQDSATGTTNYAYNAANMLLSTTGTGASSYSNDADGNTLTGGGRTNTWDSQNRLVSCIITVNSSTFKYGADGLRRQKTTNGTTTDYAYDGTMMVREGVASGGTLSQVKATYLIGPRGPEYRRDDTQTQVDGQGHTFNGKASWYVYDGLGSVVGEVDPLGNLTSSPKYDVYGAVRGNGGTATTKQGFVGSLGHLSEAETGLIYMRARYMDPTTGRFESEDVKGSGLNWYIYCQDNPTNMVDRSGCSPDFAADISRVLDLALNAFNDGLDLRNGWTPQSAVNVIEKCLARIKGISSTAKLLGEDEIAEGTATEESSAYLGPGAMMGMRAGEIQQGLGAETLAYGAAARLTGRMMEDMIEILQDSN